MALDLQHRDSNEAQINYLGIYDDFKLEKPLVPMVKKSTIKKSTINSLKHTPVLNVPPWIQIITGSFLAVFSVGV